jgi:hypothetical protein
MQGCFLSGCIGGLFGQIPDKIQEALYSYGGGTLMKNLHNIWVVGCVLMEVLQGNLVVYAEDVRVLPGLPLNDQKNSVYSSRFRNIKAAEIVQMRDENLVYVDS